MYNELLINEIFFFIVSSNNVQSLFDTISENNSLTV